MRRPSKRTLAVVAGVVVAVVLLALAVRPDERAVLTDGGAIRSRAETTVVREVLWKPATPLRAEAASADEYEPRYSADGTVVVFVRNRPGANADLYTARWTPGGWGEPEPIASINTPKDELGPELSRDGRSLYFYSDRAGGLGGYDLWVSQRIDDGWGTATNLGAQVNSRFNEYGPALTPDGERLYFSSNRPREGEPAPSGEAWTATVREHRTRHDYDLYRADVDGSSGARAVVEVNTAADEGAPSVSPAGDFLYFASDRAGGHGGFDVYRTRLIPEGRLRLIENLGQSINSPSNDLDPALSSDGFRLTFSSDRVIDQGGGAAVVSDVGRYALWTTTSREVYREIEREESRVLALLREMWPWLLLLLLALIPLVVLARLLREARWRSRFARLSLLAQCLLLSMLVHAGIASAFTVWKVGSGVIDLMQEGGDGVRVVLSSGSGAAGGIASQVRAGSTGDAALLPEVPSMPAALLVSAIEGAVRETELPPLEIGAGAPQVRVDLPSAEPVSVGMGARSGPEGLPEVHAPAPVGAGPAAPRAEVAGGSVDADIGAAARPVVSALTEATQVRVALSAIRRWETTGAPIQGWNVTAASSERTGGPAAPTTIAAPSLKVDGDSDAALPAAPRRRAVAEAASTGAEVWLPGGAQAEVAPVVAPAVGADAVIVPLPGIGGGVRGTDGGRLAVVPNAGGDRDMPSAAAIPGSAAVGSVPQASGGEVAAALPSVAAPVARRGSGSEPAKSESPAPSFAPAAVAAGDSASTSAPVMINHGRAAGSTSATAAGTPLAVAPPTIDSLPSAATQSVSAVGSSLPLTREPLIPVGIPVPLETFAQRAPESRSELLQKMGGSAETEKAVGLALEWFLRHQSREGYWSAQHFDKECSGCSGEAEFKADAAMTGLVLLCYLGAGHTHQQEGPYREPVSRALAWLVKRQTADGDLRAGETMYGQTVAAVALCEAFAMTRDPALAEPARRAVEFVLARANKGGPAAERDTSVIGWLVFTVESARRAGFTVPQGTFEAARGWLGQVADPASPGRYAYARGQGASAAMTAEAMFVQQLLGRNRAEPLMEDSARFILASPPKWGEGAPTYYWYYATLSLFQHQGDAWKQWNDQLVRELLANQEKDGPLKGSWDPTDRWSRMGGRVYQTAVCTLSLEVYYRYAAR